MNVQEFEDSRWNRAPQKRVYRHNAALSIIKKGESVLDVGCGDGLFLELLREKSVVGAGADISGVAVEKCKKKGFRSSLMKEGALPFLDNEFDTVVLLDVLEHTYAPEVLLREAGRVAKTKVIVSVPNFVSLPARMQILLGGVPENNRPRQGHIYWFTYAVLGSLFQKEGFRNIKITGNTFWEHYPVVRSVMRFVKGLFPGLFLLSFIAVGSPDK